MKYIIKSNMKSRNKKTNKKIEYFLHHTAFGGAMWSMSPNASDAMVFDTKEQAEKMIKNRCRYRGEKAYSIQKVFRP